MREFNHRDRRSRQPSRVLYPAKTRMVEYAIRLLVEGIDPEVICAAMAKTDPFRGTTEEDRRQAVKDAGDAISIADKVESYAAQKGVGFDDVRGLAHSYVSAKGSNPTQFVIKAAICCLILPKLRREASREASFEAKVKEAMVELEAMGLVDAKKTRPDQIRDSLVEAYEDHGRKAGEPYRKFCFAAAAEALKRYRAAHKAEWDAEVDRVVELGRATMVELFRGHGWNAKKVVANG